jgi:DNA primase
MIPNILEDFLGDAYAHNRDTGQMEFDCPACALDKGLMGGDGKHNLAINISQGVFKCWVCRFSNRMQGGIPKLIKKYGTKKQLQQYLLLKPLVKYENEEEVVVQADLKFPEGFKKFSTTNPNKYKYREALKYLTNRGIGMDIITEYDIGYTTDGRFFNRIIIPSYDSFGDLNYFIARSFDFKTKPKYLNPDAEKKENVFNEFKINFDATIYLVEGVFDHIVIPNSIPLLGKFIPDKLKALLYDKAKANIVIVLDDDAEEDAEELYLQLNVGVLKDRIRVCTPPADYDPSKIYEKKGSRGIRLLLQNRTKKMNLY